MFKDRFGKWIAISLLVGTAMTLIWGVWSLQSQNQLAQDVIRLHVIAASDRREDQALKLKVRDAVLAETQKWLTDIKNSAEAEKVLRSHLAELRSCAQETVVEQGYSYSVDALLTQERYPTRDYGTFALPGGEYMSLRIVIDEGAGHNWWCVVFPPLCTATVVDQEETQLSESDMGLITQKDKNYVLKFKSIEVWESLAAKWTK